MRNPETGRSAQRIRIWYSSEGQSPVTPYRVQRRWEERWVAIPDELMEPVEEPWTVSTEHGETPEP